jgi:hypothetical protein
VLKTDGATAARFIDNLIGSTTIEYEADLRIPAKRQEGFRQVQDHVAGLVRSGVAVSQVRGILSDTVEWYIYDVTLNAGITPAHCTAADISLSLVEELQLSTSDEATAHRFIDFLRKHLAREQSRPLTAEFLSSDLGLDRPLYQRSCPPLTKLVSDGRAVDSAIRLATDLWSEFVDFLEGETGGFRAGAYVDEVYLCLMARLLSANVLAEKAISSDDQELESILNGTYFQDRHQLRNMVEVDYFGWLVSSGHIADVIPVAREIQRDLYAYDFSSRPEEDLFGRLMAELGRRSQRKLLGQEWTPKWLARLLAIRCLENLPEGEEPRLVDMCCGSGTIIAEVLKAAKQRFSFADIQSLQDVVTGFDIDPLAVSLAKTTWVVTLASEIKAASAPIIIPIYHADSLFAVTPGLAMIPMIGSGDPVPVSLDGSTIDLPHAFVQPIYRDLFDRIVDWAYDEAADAQPGKPAIQITLERADAFLVAAASTTNTQLPDELRARLAEVVQAIAARMFALARANRNGIWAFILRNTYRPGLVREQFNGLVSNPPWLALSALAENPYTEALTARARLYGIRPAGQSFLHLELGTTHLIHAIDSYLKAGAAIACLVPGTIFNGHHHEPLRKRAFLSADRPVAFDIREVWHVAAGTFKYPGAALIGTKRGAVADCKTDALKGFFASADGLDEAEFSIRELGSERTAWVLAQEGSSHATGGMGEFPQQGADLMPRTALCVEIMTEHGSEYRVDTPGKASRWAHTVKAAKEMKADRFPGYVSPRFIYRMAQSENLLPFVLGEHCVPIAVPAERDETGEWRILEDAEIRGGGLIETARRFQRINAALAKVGKGKTLQQRIDERGKLSKQIFGDSGYLLLVGAGGKNICAACLPIAEAKDLLIDQTLYWKVIFSAEEAGFCVGLLNSRALTEAIKPFNPKGAFGERHIHALPYQVMPAFDPVNVDHQKIAALALSVGAAAAMIAKNDPYIGDPSRALTRRRSKLRELLEQMEEVDEMEQLCAQVLGAAS